MKLYNTLTRQVSEFVPIDASLVTLYACGPTVYDYTHLGHLRKYTMDDVLVRTLRHSGYELKFVRNITDVGHLASDGDTGEDKMVKGAKKYGTTVWDVARKFEDYFHDSVDAMNNVRPNITSRVTEHITSQIELVKTLEEKGYAYVIPDDGVYFDTSKFPRYGELARLNIEGQEEGARVEKISGKRNPADFALWKFERDGENREMVWESPWHSRSFPGWHIECSAISMEHLGEQIDIHTGGIDHIPVHHTNEIAQSEAATGRHPFVRYWVHYNFLLVEGQKMSKSLNNFYTIDDVREKGYDPMALRLLFLSAHYRSEMNFTWKNLEGAQVSWERLIYKIQQLLEEKETEEELAPENLARADRHRTTFFGHMENDLKVPEALAVLWEVVGDDSLTARQKYHLLLSFDEVLGLGLARIQPEETIEVPAVVQKLLDERQEARQRKDWQKADTVREEIERLGYEVMDEADGQRVKKK